MNEFLQVWVFGLLAATLVFAAPLIMAGLGGLVSERSGIVNIALEGMMTAGAFFAIWGSVQFDHWAAGVMLAIVSGAAFALIHAVATVTFRADHIVSGTGVILLAFGLVNFLNATLFPSEGSPPNISEPWSLPSSGIWREIGAGGLSSLTLVALLLVPLVWLVVFRTPFGLHLRAVGEHPQAADTVGIRVLRMRYVAVLLSGCLAGLAGAFISFNVGSYTENMVAGNGFIALAALILGKWNPKGVLFAALLFGFARALASRLSDVEWIPVALRANELIAMLPYVITLIALAGVIGRSVPPAAVGRIYEPK